MGDKGSGFGDDSGLGEGLVVEGGLEGGLEGLEGLTFPPWQWEWKVAVAPMLLSWWKVSSSRERWAMV